MIPRPTPKAFLPRLGLAVLSVGSVLAGCSGQTPEPDTAELVIPSKAPAEPAKPEVPAPEPAKESPRG